MVKKDTNLTLFLILIVIGFGMWSMSIPQGLDAKGWHVFIIFLMTIVGIITSVLPMGAVALTAIAALVLTKTLKLEFALEGFSSPTAWLVVIAFFVARGFIKTNLGKRMAYILISRFGKTTNGLSYSLIATEFVLSMMIPSVAARSGGIIFPISNSLADEYRTRDGKPTKTGAFIIAICFHMNVICSALFITAMAGNPLIQDFGLDLLKVNVSWGGWALATIVPGLINLILLPFILSLVLKPEIKTSNHILEKAHTTLKEMGRLSRNETIMICTFLFMLTLWIFGKYIGVDATTAGITGLLILIVTQVIRWDDVVSEKGAWETIFWFATLLMLAKYLNSFGVSGWVEDKIKTVVGSAHPVVALIVINLINFYIHYFFASVTAHITVLFTTFLLILVSLGVPPLAAIFSLAVTTNLSASLTHYGNNAAPIYFGAGYFNIREWMKMGFVVGTINLLLWSVLATIWWKILGFF